jgi:hypothetical protein
VRSQAILMAAYLGVVVVGALLCILAGVMGS